MAKIFEIVRPRSLTDENFESFEYLIRWIGKDGAEYLHMFYNARLKRRTRNDIINASDSSGISAMTSKEERSIELFVDDLSKNDLEIVLQMFTNKYLTRLKKDGTFERLAPDENSIKYRLMDGRFEIQFVLIQPDLTVCN